MKQFLNQACYIWTTPFESGTDLYRRFRKKFYWNPKSSTTVTLCIAADSTCAVALNGRRCPVSQTADFPLNRRYSEFDITDFLHHGENVITVEVHFLGEEFLTYAPGVPFLKAALIEGQDIILKTDSSWKCSANTPFTSGLNCQETPQLGYVFEYDARREIPWKEISFDDSSWENAVEYPSLPWETMKRRNIPQLLELSPPVVRVIQAGYLKRENEGQTFAETCSRDYLLSCRSEELFKELNPEQFYDRRTWTKPILNLTREFCYSLRPLPAASSPDGYYLILDLQKEQVGFPYLKICAPSGTIIDLCHGEHLDDGRIRARIGKRNFADRFICREGLNEFLYLHRRIGARYLELHITKVGSGEVNLLYAGIIPLELPLPQSATFLTEDHFLKHLNTLSTETLKLCMHEHYEDCPWREQSLYAYDSRSQILYGYYIWGNYTFAGENLDLLGYAFDKERYLELTAPGKCSKTIPIFTMAWISAVYEHFLYSGSLDLFKKWKRQINQILDRALSEKEPSAAELYNPGSGNRIWNFYEWNGTLRNLQGAQQAPYNLYLYEALEKAAKLHERDGDRERAKYLFDTAQRLGRDIENIFWDSALSCYGSFPPGSNPLVYEHIQCLMLAHNLVPKEKKNALLKLFFTKQMRTIELSALRWLIDAMMKNGSEARRFLMTELRSIFEPIVYAGATSLWETRLGSDDFGGAGSLCHGWSSVMPYFCGRYLLGIEPLDEGFKRFLVKPYCVDLTHVSGEVPTPFGVIRVSWRKDGNSLNIRVEHPEGTIPVSGEYEEYPVARFETIVR